jgi:hypothetical protein
MAKLLFPDFLEHPESYDAAEAVWKARFDALAAKHHFTYTPYINVFARNGDKLRDGNPIFSAEVKTLNRAVRIIQEAVEQPDDFFISAWLDTFPIDEDNPLNELVIPLVLSEETLELAERLILHWLVEGLSKEEMERVLEEELALLE